MNENLKKLMKEADYPAPEIAKRAHKLSELIVRECAQICRNQPNVYALKADRDNCAIAIEQHFGVEE